MALADLATGVRQARAHQTLDDIHAKGGPSPNTVGKISRFNPAKHAPWPIRPATLAELNVGIDGWVPAKSGQPGTAEQLYELPAEAAGVMVTDVAQLAELVGDRVIAQLISRLQLNLSLSDAP